MARFISSPVPIKWSDQEKRFGFAIKESVDVLSGLRGDPLDKAITARELINYGVIRLKEGQLTYNLTTGARQGRVEARTLRLDDSSLESNINNELTLAANAVGEQLLVFIENTQAVTQQTALSSVFEQSEPPFKATAAEIGESSAVTLPVIMGQLNNIEILSTQIKDDGNYLFDFGAVVSGNATNTTQGGSYVALGVERKVAGAASSTYADFQSQKSDEVTNGVNILGQRVGIVNVPLAKGFDYRFKIYVYLRGAGSSGAVYNTFIRGFRLNTRS
tara:strand:- start:2010 stop:2834 length:825 start_codon:yes stop_codon:yes gene_type:complete